MDIKVTALSILLMFLALSYAEAAKTKPCNQRYSQKFCTCRRKCWRKYYKCFDNSGSAKESSACLFARNRCICKCAKKSGIVALMKGCNRYGVFSGIPEPVQS